MGGRSVKRGRAATLQQWAAALNPVDRALYVAYNTPRLRMLQARAKAGVPGASAAASDLQRRLDACRKAAKNRATPPDKEN